MNEVFAIPVPPQIQTVRQVLPGTPNVYNVTMTTAATEYSQALPANTRKIFVKLRDTTNDLKIAFTSGQSGTTYLTVPAGSGGMNIDLVELQNTTLYMQSPVASQTAEIIAFT